MIKDLELAGGAPSLSLPVYKGGLTVIVLGVKRGGGAVFSGLYDMRGVFPDATYILSTSRTEAKALADVSFFDRVIISDDPGMMASDRFEGGATDINQMKRYALEALTKTQTDLVVVLKAGSSLFSREALDLWSYWEGRRLAQSAPRSRILVSKFFTMIPSGEERLPYQVGTSFQLGRTADLVDFWSGPEYPFEIAVWYESRPHSKRTSKRERALRALFTPDQWFTLHYLFPLRNFPINYFNDCSAGVIEMFEKLLGERFIVAHPKDIDLHDREHIHCHSDAYLNLLCYSASEWRSLADPIGDTEVDFKDEFSVRGQIWRKDVASLLLRRRIGDFTRKIKKVGSQE